MNRKCYPTLVIEKFKAFQGAYKWDKPLVFLKLKVNEVQVLFKEKQKDHQGLGLIAKNCCSFKDKGKMHMKYQIYLYLLVWFTIFIEEYAFVCLCYI